MFNVTEKIIAAIRAISALVSIREIVVKDITELEELYDVFNKNSDKMFSKNKYDRKAGDSIRIIGCVFSCKTTQELEAENKELIKKQEQNISTIRHLTNELYKKDYTTEQIREIVRL